MGVVVAVVTLWLFKQNNMMLIMGFAYSGVFGISFAATVITRSIIAVLKEEEGNDIDHMELIVFSLIAPVIISVILYWFVAIKSQNPLVLRLLAAVGVFSVIMGAIALVGLIRKKLTKSKKELKQNE